MEEVHAHYRKTEKYKRIFLYSFLNSIWEVTGTQENCVGRKEGKKSRTPITVTSISSLRCTLFSSGHVGGMSQEVLKPRSVQGGAQVHRLPVALSGYHPVFALRSSSGGIK